MSVDQAREEWQAAGDYDSACRLIRAQAARIAQLERELAAEKALADRLAEDLEGHREAIDPDCKDSCCQYARETEVVLDAYRKARGL